MKTRIYSKDILLVLAATFFYMASPMLVTPLITGFTESIGASAALMGIVGGMMNLCSLVCRPFAGNLADKISKYRVSLIGAVLMAAACIGYMTAKYPAFIILSRIVNGIGFSCCSVCMATWMSNMLPQNRIGSGMGLYGTMNALAMAVAPAIGVGVYQTIGYRASFGIALAFSVAIIVVIQFIGDRGEPVKEIKEIQEENAAETDSSGKPDGAKTGLKLVDVRVIPVALIIMLFAIPYCATQSFLVTYAKTLELNINVGSFFPSYAAVLIILRLSLRGLFDRLPFRIFLLTGSLCAFLSILCLALMKDDWMMLLAAVFMAGGYGIMSSVCQSTAILLAGKDKRGLANSTYYIGLDLGMAFGPMIGGVLYGNLDIRLFYPVLMATIPMVGVVYLAAGKRLKGELSIR